MSATLALQLPRIPNPIAANTIKLTHPGFASFNLNTKRNTVSLSRCSHSAISKSAYYDPELHLVLELATNDELFELENILFGPSYFSPLLKSLTNGADVDFVMVGEDLEEREELINILESRFLFLAADARSTLRGWRPSYRNVLLDVRRKLNIQCSSKLPTEDLEIEVFLHLLEGDLSEGSGTPLRVRDSQEGYDGQGSLELGLSRSKVQALSALGVGAAELKSIILKGGSLITLAKIYELLGRRLSGKMFLEAANYQIKKEVIKKGGQIAAINLESRAAMLAAKQGLAGAASRYLGFRSLTMLLGPMYSEDSYGASLVLQDSLYSHPVTWDILSILVGWLWGTFLADIVIQMLGTDYARIVRAIYAFAQIRITRTHQL